MNSNPLVTVIIPTYNRPKYVSRAIQSVLNQTYPSIEIIVVDDASDADLQPIIDQFPSVSFLVNDSNRGGGFSRNRGIAQAKGTFINFLDDDDILYPKKIESQISLFIQSDVPDLGMITCHALDERSGEAHIRYNRFQGDIHRKLLRSFAISGIETMLYRKECLEEVGGFDEQLQSSQEYDLLIRVSEKYGVDYVDEVLTQEFESTNQISTNFDKKIQGAQRLFKKHNWRYKKQGLLFWIKMRIKLLFLLFRFYVGKILGEKAYRMLLIRK